MFVIIGLIIIAIGAFCQSSSYVPINKVKEMSWESYWLVQGCFAWLIFPIMGAWLAVPEGREKTPAVRCFEECVTQWLSGQGLR